MSLKRVNNVKLTDLKIVEKKRYSKKQMLSIIENQFSSLKRRVPFFHFGEKLKDSHLRQDLHQSSPTHLENSFKKMNDNFL